MVGPKRGYLVGFLFYWVFWCMAFPLWTVNPEGLRSMFKAARPPFGEPGWLGLTFLLPPVLASFAMFSAKKLSKTTLPVLVASALFSLVNDTMEEVLWRGAYATTFPDSWLWGLVYPSIAFGLWHLSPQVINPSMMLGRPLTFAIVAIFLGLPLG